jgi:hypothetical protein
MRNKVPTGMTMKPISSRMYAIFLVKVCSRFEGKHSLHFQGGKLRRATRQAVISVVLCLFHFKDKGSTCLRNKGKFLPDYTVSFLRRKYSSTVIYLLLDATKEKAFLYSSREISLEQTSITRLVT